jgi:CheY-like chemotaxis protein
MSKQRILLVDDEPGITHMLRLNLEQTGRFEVLEENRGSHAIAAAQAFRPDLIFLDVMMPDLGGEEVAERLREDPDLCDTRFVFLTAIVTKEETGGGAANISGNIFLAKPVRRQELLDVVTLFLGPGDAAD